MLPKRHKYGLPIYESTDIARQPLSRPGAKRSSRSPDVSRIKMACRRHITTCDERRTEAGELGHERNGLDISSASDDFSHSRYNVQNVTTIRTEYGHVCVLFSC